MTKRSLTVTVFLLTLILTAGALPNVRDFGAKGDGKTDDTAALQKAVDSLTRKLSTYGSRTLYFPRGRCKISKRITLNKIHLKGDSAVIVQTNPKEDIFYYTFAWNTRISGLEFQGLQSAAVWEAIRPFSRSPTASFTSAVRQSSATATGQVSARSGSPAIPK